MNSFTQSFQASMFIAALFIAALFIICTISLALRNYEIRHELKKLKKWREFSEIEKRQKHEEYDRIAAELAEEREFNDTQGSMHVRLMLKYAHVQEEDDKLRLENTSLRTDLKARETELDEVSKERYRIACKNTDLIVSLGQKETFITELKKELKQYQDAVKDLRIEIDSLKAKSTRKRDLMGRFIKQSEVIERDWTQASKDELLAEAKRRYPVGTKIKCLHSQPYDLIEIQNFELDKYSFCMRCRNLKGYVNCVYMGGEWAQIITE